MQYSVIVPDRRQALPADLSREFATRPAPLVRLRAALLALLPFMVMLAITLAIRSWRFGNPDVDFDEPFYLLVGDRMLHGAIPYIDLWDRKPLGLFVIYAAIRLLGGAGFTQYLVTAALFVAGTGAFIQSLARRWVGRWAAIVPAIAYVISLEPYSGEGGQTAAFYNLFMIAAFWLLVRARDLGRTRRTVLHGLAAMALVGISIQVKYTVLPEGMFIGLGFLWALYRQQVALSRLAATAAGMIALALAPTLAAIGWYWSMGHLDAYAYANFTSLFQRGRLPSYYVIQNLRYIGLVAVPLAGAAIFGLGRMAPQDRPLMIGWLLAALAGFFMIGNFYHYYFMPVLVPLCAAAAPNLAERRWGAMLFAFVMAFPFAIGQVVPPRETGDRIASVDRLTQRIVPHIDAAHCLYVFDGPTALYMTTHSCLPTRFAYPDHLTNDVERPALGVDATAELRRVLASQPGAIVTARPRLVPTLNAANVALMQQTLARDYYPVTRVRHAWRIVTVWARKHGPGATPAGNRWHQDEPIRLYPPSILWPDSPQKSR